MKIAVETPLDRERARVLLADAQAQAQMDAVHNELHEEFGGRWHLYRDLAAVNGWKLTRLDHPDGPRLPEPISVSEFYTTDPAQYAAGVRRALTHAALALLTRPEVEAYNARRERDARDRRQGSAMEAFIAGL
jgi:hypothetical protein